MIKLQTIFQDTGVKACKLMGSSEYRRPDAPHEEAWSQAQLELVVDVLGDIFKLIDDAAPRLQAMNLNGDVVLAALAAVALPIQLEFGLTLARDVLDDKATCHEAKQSFSNLHMAKILSRLNVETAHGMLTRTALAALALAAEIGDLK